MFGLLEIFFLLVVKIKTKMLHKTPQGKASTVNNSSKYKNNVSRKIFKK